MSDFRFYVSFVFIGMAYMLILGIIMAPTEPAITNKPETATHHVMNMKNQFIDGPRVRVKFASIPPVYICERCGGTQTIKLPKDVPQLEAELEEFEKDHLHEKNRDVNGAHVQNLIEAIKKNNLLSGQPLLVNEHMEVIDGQHRLAAAKELDTDIYYIQQDGLKIEDAIDLNINTKNWGYNDYLEYWISQGNEDYIYYKKYKDRYGMSWSISISLLHNGEASTRNTRDTFISGEFEAAHKAYAETIGRLTLVLSRYGDFSNDRSLIRALDGSIRKGYLDYHLLLKKVRMVPDKFTKCSDTESYLMMLESVINHYQKGQRIRLY